MDLDLLVIGSGPSGQKAAIQAAKLGKHVAVAERRDRLGGDDPRGAIHQLMERELLGLLDAGGVEHVERALREDVEHGLA